MKYAVWNNKGGVGKTFLSFVLGTELANKTKQPVLLVDMCPQANLSEIVLGGNGIGSERLDDLIKKRNTVGGYFDSRIASPHSPTNKETEFLIHARKYNSELPEKLYLIAGDPSLEIQAQVINQIGGQSLPVDAWKNVHYWLRDLVASCSQKLGIDSTTVFMDCNPSFSAYTELAMLAADRIIAPCSSDGSSARAIDNLGALVYGVQTSDNYGTAIFPNRAEHFSMKLPQVHSVLMNRSTLYNEAASKAFKAMHDEISRRVHKLQQHSPKHFVEGKLELDTIPDSHSVAIVCSHLGKPLYRIKPGKYEVHDSNPQVNPEPLDRYRTAVSRIIEKL